MVGRRWISKAMGGVVVAAGLTLTPAAGGIVFADNSDINIGVGELQECTISKSMDTGGGDVDGRDFLVWQRGSTVPIQSVGGSDLADWQANYGAGY